MEISDELIACYVEGTLTADERDMVRRYLCCHPEEYERVLCLMDNDRADYLQEVTEVSGSRIPQHESSFSDIAYSAAAFAPAQNSQMILKVKANSAKAEEVYGRLKKISDELDDTV